MIQSNKQESSENGSYSAPHARQRIRLTPVSVELAAMIYRLAGRAEYDRTFNDVDMVELKALDKLFESITGISALKAAGLSQ